MYEVDSVAAARCLECLMSLPERTGPLIFNLKIIEIVHVAPATETEDYLAASKSKEFITCGQATCTVHVRVRVALAAS